MQHMRLRIIYDPILRQKANPVELFDSALKTYADEMLTIMRRHNGLGLAAPQVGLDKRLIVFGYEPTGPDDELPRIPFTALVNPKVTKFSKEKETLTEGCLSLPGLELPVTRSAGVTVEAFNLAGETVTLKAKGLVARILQHEIDHLDGILFTDRADSYTDIADYRYARIVFIGSDEFSRPAFNVLAASGLTLTAVITETAKPSGRGGALRDPIMKEVATTAGIAVFQPAEMEELVEVLRQLEPDLVILASYGKILSAEALAVPTYGCLNIHPSLLPKYRGPTPIPSAILNGDDQTGVTIIKMNAKVDAGEILGQATESILPTDTTVTLREKLFTIGGRLLLDLLPAYLAGQAKFEMQDPSEVTKTYKLTKEMGEIDWNKDLKIIDREIRAFQPWPGAFTLLDGKRLKILASHLEGSKLVLETVQLEGKKPSSWPDFQRGYAHLLKKTEWYSKLS